MPHVAKLGGVFLPGGGVTATAGNAILSLLFGLK
jgi:hypothetical protein